MALIKVKQIEFSDHDSFTVGKIEGTNQIRYYIYKEGEKFITIDIQSIKHSFNSIEKAKKFCQKDFENFINNLIEKN